LSQLFPSNWDNCSTLGKLQAAARLTLDLNRASEAVGRSVGELRETVSGLKAVFFGFCTQNRKSLFLCDRRAAYRYG